MENNKGHDSAITTIATQTFNYVWTINNFDKCINPETLEMHFSKLDYEWKFNLVKMNSIFALNVSTKTFVEKARFTIVITYVTNQTHRLPALMKNIYNLQPDEAHCLIEMTISDNHHIPIKTIFIHYKIEVVNSNKFHVEHIQVPIYKDQLLGDFGQLVDNPEFADLTVKVRDESIRAHKAILATSSPVFRQLIKSSESVVNVNDFPYNVMLEVIRFVYSGGISGDVKLKQVQDLLAAAEKFELHGLKLLCEETLSDAITNLNVSELSELADKYKAENLKRCAVSYKNNMPAHF